MLTKKGEVKVTDFGLAQLGKKEGDGNLTEDGMTLGTPLYMSPEQVRGADLDLRTDIYSFGVTCYHMLCGSPPFQGTQPMAIAIQHVNETPEPITDREPSIPEPLARMVHRMMARDRDDRYQSPEEVYEDVKKLISARKSRQDLNLVKLPCLSKMEAKDAASKSSKATVGTIPHAARPTAKKTRKAPSRKLASSASKQKSTATRKAAPTISLPEAKGEPKPKPKRPRDDDEEEFTLRTADTEFEDMDLTPMVDVTFLLLIFFMITASFTLQNTITVPPPDPNDGASMKPASEEMEQEVGERDD